jgi:hypothetical protein
MSVTKSSKAIRIITSFEVNARAVKSDKRSCAIWENSQVLLVVGVLEVATNLQRYAPRPKSTH